MKTNLMKLVKVVALAAMTMMLANCSKDNGSSSSGIGYSMNAYGQCVQTSTGQIAPNSTYCTTSNNGYSYVNGQCVYTATGQIAASPSYCTTTTAYGSNICNGTFYYNQGYGVQTIQCSSSSSNYYSQWYQSGYGQVYNCRGLSLSPTTTLQSFINCQ